MAIFKQSDNPFVGGLTQPSGFSVIVMLMTIFSLAIACLLGMPAFIRSDYAPLLADRREDHQLYVTSALERLGTDDSKRPLLAIVGASVTRSSFGRTSDIEQSLKDMSGENYQAINFAAGRQSLLEHLIFIGRLPKDRRVTVVLGLGPSRFTVTTKRYKDLVWNFRYGTDSALYRSEALQLGLGLRRDTGWMLIDHFDFYFPRFRSVPKNLLRVMSGRSIAQNELQYVGTRKPEHVFRRHSAAVMDRFEDYHSARELNRSILQRTLNYVAEQPNMSLVLVEHPINPKFVTDFIGSTTYANHIQFMTGLAEEHNVPYWTLGLDAGLEEDSFNDWAHIGSAQTQVQLRTMLISRLMEDTNE